MRGSRVDQRDFRRRTERVREHPICRPFDSSRNRLEWESGSQRDGHFHGAGLRGERDVREQRREYGDSLATSPAFSANGTVGGYSVLASAAGAMATASFSSFSNVAAPATGNPLTTWTYTATASRDGNVYTGASIGRSPICPVS
jgi:hypothetical protein